MMLSQKEAEEHQRKQQQGLGRPIISFEANGQRIVCVGSRMFSSPRWKTFHDFLGDYPILLFGEPWLAKQRKFPPERQHPYLQWRRKAIEDYRQFRVPTGAIASGQSTAAISSTMTLAYNLYLIHHNLAAGQNNAVLCQRLVKRLKNPDHFWGALYETYAFSLFAIAGFDMELEDESDRLRTHCEFTARSKQGRSYSVECKGRNRTSVSVDENGLPLVDAEVSALSKKLKDALTKSSSHDRVVFLDMDLPTVTHRNQIEAVADLMVPKLKELESTLMIDGAPAPPAYVFVTNIPDHRSAADVSSGFMAFAAGFKIPNFGHGVYHRGMHELVRARDQHTDILSLREAVQAHHTIPSTFDGTNPVLAFSRDRIPRLRIGDWYVVPDKKGRQMRGQLCDGIVLVGRKEAFCTYRSESGEYFHGTNKLTDDEVSAYRLHPETFFGAIKSDNTRKVETAVEFFDFVFETYQHTPKEKLLEFLANVPDIVELTKLSQRELAITYCERLAQRFHDEMRVSAAAGRSKD